MDSKTPSSDAHEPTSGPATPGPATPGSATPNIDALKKLGMELDADKAKKYTDEETRVRNALRELVAFVMRNGRLPKNHVDKDIFERLNAIRFDLIRNRVGYTSLAEELDPEGLLNDPSARGVGTNMRNDTSNPHLGSTSSLRDAEKAAQSEPDQARDDLLALLATHEKTDDIGQLRFVRSADERNETKDRRTAEEIAERTKCLDFDSFEPQFELAKYQLKLGIREARPVTNYLLDVKVGDFFILGGMLVYVAAREDEFTNSHGDKDWRIRAIFDNGTESNLLRQSLLRALNKDASGRFLTNYNEGELFNERSNAVLGKIYIARSLSDLPEVSANRDVLHKIGVTTQSLEKRIANAETDRTFLLARVEIVASYDVSGINPQKLENLLHNFFAQARLDIEITDDAGEAYRPQEWFLVPLSAIDETVTRVYDRSILDYFYDPKRAGLVARDI